MRGERDETEYFEQQNDAKKHDVYMLIMFLGISLNSLF